MFAINVQVEMPSEVREALHPMMTQSGADALAVKIKEAVAAVCDDDEAFPAANFALQLRIKTPAERGAHGAVTATA